jgi:hypothetical protein
MFERVQFEIAYYYEFWQYYDFFGYFKSQGQKKTQQTYRFFTDAFYFFLIFAILSNQQTYFYCNAPKFTLFVPSVNLCLVIKTFTVVNLWW